MRRSGATCALGAACALGAPGAPAGAAELVPGPALARAHVATILAPTAARREPWQPAGATPLSPRTPWGGGSTRLLVLDSVRYPARGRRSRVWLRVALPERPNGSSGWVRADRATLAATAWRVHVSVARRRVSVLRRGRVVRRFRAVVGAPATPTPIGNFAVYEAIRQPDPGGFLGPWALHLTAFSNVLEDFGGGPGRIGLHGRGAASLADPLGSARSHGCIRVDNAAIRFLARVAPAGTPVRITR